MPASNEKILVGLIGPEVLSAIEEDSMNPVFLDIEACNALEIRYDFFPEKEWPALSRRVKKIAPGAMQVGTIRLERDGGRFPDKDAYSRIPLWSKILAEGDVPEWLDLEQDCLYDFKNLKNLADLRKTKMLVSQHNFLRIPNLQELDDFARDCLRMKADGLKIAAMSNSETDCERLYKFARIHSQNFELFAAFGQGEPHLVAQGGGEPHLRVNRAGAGPRPGGRRAHGKGHQGTRKPEFAFRNCRFAVKILII